MLLVVRGGIKLAGGLGLSHVKVETDAAKVVKLWMDRTQGRSEIVPKL
jgi:hypothetical protein